MISLIPKLPAYCGGLILKQTDMKTTMLWCSLQFQPTQEQINELGGKRKIYLQKKSNLQRHWRGISNCPNNRQREELISDFRDVLESFMLVHYCTIGRKPIVLIHGRTFIQGAMNVGSFYSPHSERSM
jgi:hypothetical protein